MGKETQGCYTITYNNTNEWIAAANVRTDDDVEHRSSAGARMELH